MFLMITEKNNGFSYKSIIYSCALNNRGGVEAQFTVNILEPGNGAVIKAKFQVRKLGKCNN